MIEIQRASYGRNDVVETTSRVTRGTQGFRPTLIAVLIAFYQHQPKSKNKNRRSDLHVLIYVDESVIAHSNTTVGHVHTQQARV